MSQSKTLELLRFGMLMSCIVHGPKGDLELAILSNWSDWGTPPGEEEMVVGCFE